MNIRERFFLQPVLTTMLRARENGQVGVSTQRVYSLLKSRALQFYAKLLGTPVTSTQFTNTLARVATMSRIQELK
ncbi:MAG TPA: hypothetical protein VJJ02_03360 [Candidatus Paceibacterota bacterium]